MKTLRMFLSSIIFLPIVLFADVPSHPLSFHEGMKLNTSYKTAFVKKKQNWKLFKEFYDSYLENYPILLGKNSYRIPKKIHLIWLGSPLPDVYKTMFESWKKYHPTWEVKLWTDKEIKEFGPLKNQKAYEVTKNWGEKSDIARYEILYRLGGLYVDTDFECLKPFDELHKTCDFYAGLFHGSLAFLGNGIIGSVPRHPILKRCIDSITVGPGDTNFGRILNSTGPSLFTNKFIGICKQIQKKERHMKGRIIVPLPVSLVYPLPDNWRVFRDKGLSVEEIKKQWIQPQSMAVHYWDISWLKK